MQGYPASSEKPASRNAHGLPTALFSGKPTLLAGLWTVLQAHLGRKGLRRFFAAQTSQAEL